MMRKLTAEEKLQKEAELAKMRHLLFYKEKKLAVRRVTKVKGAEVVSKGIVRA